MARTGRSYPARPIVQTVRVMQTPIVQPMMRGGPQVVARRPPRIGGVAAGRTILLADPQRAAHPAMVRVVRGQRVGRGMIVSYRAPSTLPAAFDRPRLPVIVSAVYASPRRPGRVSFTWPIGLRVPPAVTATPLPAPFFVRAVKQPRRPGRVWLAWPSALRDVAAPRQPLLIRAVRQARRPGRVWFSWPSALRDTPPLRQPLLVRATRQPRRPGRVWLAWPSALRDTPPIRRAIIVSLPTIRRRAGKVTIGHVTVAMPTPLPLVAFVQKLVRRKPRPGRVATQNPQPYARAAQRDVVREAIVAPLPRSRATRRGRIVYTWPGLAASPPPVVNYTAPFTSEPAAGTSDSPSQGAFNDWPLDGPSSDPTQGRFS